MTEVVPFMSNPPFSLAHESNDNSFLYGYGDGVDSHILSEAEQLQFAEFLNGLAPAGSGPSSLGAGGCASSGGSNDQPPPPPPPPPPSYQNEFEHSDAAYRNQPPPHHPAGYVPSASWRGHDGPDSRAQQQQQQQQQHYYHHQHQQQHPQQYSRHPDPHLQYAAHPGQPPLHPLPMTNAPLPYLSDDRTSMIIPAESPKSDRRHSHAGAFDPQFKDETRHDGHYYTAEKPDHHMYLNTHGVHHHHQPNSSEYSAGSTPAIVVSEPHERSSGGSSSATLRGAHVGPSGVFRPHSMETMANGSAAAINRLPQADEHSQLRRHSVAVAESRRNSIIPAPSPSQSFAGANSASPLSAPPSTAHRPTVLPTKPAARKTPPTATTASSPAKKRKRKASATAVPAASSHPSSNSASPAPTVAISSVNTAPPAFEHPGANRRWSTISDLSLPAYQPTRPDGEPGDDDQLPSAGGSGAGGGGRGKKSGKPLLTDEEKRANHIESEKKRRQNIRTGFDQLVQIVPTLGQCQRSESLILQKSVEYVQHLMAHQAEYQARIAHMRVLLGEDGGQSQQSQHQQPPPPQRPPGPTPNDNR
ncbi:hypothetical protein BDZ88DRAFT_408624 [Geranomyces variabilis]|nr:hypothetical protein BDZ88DRAFT_408624 [Geranomyces variabilis]KAJ3142170.1 hypothetical protein HDU90_004443 [Geranomyces variabilis]